MAMNEGLIIIGLTLILFLTAIYIVLLWLKNKKLGLLWFLPQLAMLYLSLRSFIDLLTNESTIPAVMLSEENSLAVGLMGTWWILSMIFMTLGLVSIFKGTTSNRKEAL